jgi:hypothetical protein
VYKKRYWICPAELLLSNTLNMPATYEFLYFKGHGLGMIPRLLLSLGGFDWKDVHPKVCVYRVCIALDQSLDDEVDQLIELGRR